MKAENIVRLLRYRNMTPTPAKRQKLERALIDELAPMKKAIAFVREVIVTELPDSLNPSLILRSTV
jgi:hypothetical protein